MSVAFVMVKTEASQEKKVHAALQKINEIKELHPLFGEYDLIAKVEAKNYDAMGAIIVEKIRTIPGVLDTKTLVGIKLKQKK
ncbi:MAG: Lrp/AsnC ligand binding domain-containing protein [Thermoplasmata archaeon]